MAPPDQYAMHTVAMQAAAKDTQNFLLRNHGRSQESLAMIFRQMGRAVHRNWRGLACTLMANHVWTRDFISVVEGRVSIVDHARFQMEFDLAQRRAGAHRRRALERSEAAETQAELRKRLQGQQRAHRRRSKLWAPSGSRKYLIGLVKEDGEVAGTLEEINVGLASFWGSVFCPANHPDTARKMAMREKYVSKFALPQA
eukprot:4053242-Pyramimonas_sp.AAC.1